MPNSKAVIAISSNTADGVCIAAPRIGITRKINPSVYPNVPNRENGR